MNQHCIEVENATGDSAVHSRLIVTDNAHEHRDGAVCASGMLLKRQSHTGKLHSDYVENEQQLDQFSQSSFSWIFLAQFLSEDQRRARVEPHFLSHVKVRTSITVIYIHKAAPAASA